MTFDGILMETLGDAKVTKWTENLSTSADRKEIQYRGRVRAAVSVPTLRTIEAEIRVKGHTKEDASLLVLTIAEWLQSTGVAKLKSERDENRYYMAACTAISAPEYIGIAAKFTVTFTCTDHRPYSITDDEPIGTSETDLSNFTFNGKHCLTDMGCVFEESKRQMIPATRAIRYELPGGNGTLRYNTGRPVYEEKTLTGVLYLVTSETVDGLMTEAAITQKQHDIAYWLLNPERATFVFDSDATREYQAEIIDAADIDRSSWENGAIKITIVLQPISKDITAKTQTNALTLSAGVAQTISYAALLGGGMGYETPLKLEITNAGASAITDLFVYYYDAADALHYIRFTGAGFSLAAGQKLTIDGETFYADINGTTAMKYIYIGDFPYLAPEGTKSIQLKTAAGSSISVKTTFNVRWV